MRIVATIAVLAGAVSSFGLMLAMGHRNPSILLILLFAGWDLAPFAALLWAVLRAKAKRPALLRGMATFIGLAAPSVYAYVVYGPPRPQPAAAFLLVPAASWVLIAVAVFL